MHTSSFERSLRSTWVSQIHGGSRGHSHHLFAKISEIYNLVNKFLHMFSREMHILNIKGEKLDRLGTFL